MGTRTAIVGVGQTNHTSKRKDVNGQELINEAVKRALQDAGCPISPTFALTVNELMGRVRPFATQVRGNPHQ